MARKVDWSQIPWEDVNDQVSRKVIMGDRVMMVMYRFQAGLTWPEERHEAEQGGYVLKGKAEARSGGNSFMLGPGDSYFIESNVPHSTHFVDETILIDIFSPPRKELMEKDRGFAPSATKK